MNTADILPALVHDWAKSGGDKELENRILEILDSDSYRALPYAIRNRPFLTSSKLKAFRDCPYHAKLKYLDEVDPGFDGADYFVIGQAVDDWLTLGLDHFACHYQMVARRTEKAAEEHEGKTLLSPSQFETVEHAVAEFQSRSFFPKQPKKRNVIWLMAGMPCKAELDHFDADARRIGDIKTTANIATFDPTDYALQMSFYAFGIEKKWEEKVEAELYVVDKHSDWSRSHKWLFSRSTLSSHYFEVETLVEQWKESQETGIWPHVDPETEKGRRICWNSEYYATCPFCKADSPTIV